MPDLWTRFLRAFRRMDVAAGSSLARKVRKIISTGKCTTNSNPRHCCMVVIISHFIMMIYIKALWQWKEDATRVQT